MRLDLDLVSLNLLFYCPAQNCVLFIHTVLLLLGFNSILGCVPRPRRTYPLFSLGFTDVVGSVFLRDLHSLDLSILKSVFSLFLSADRYSGIRVQSLPFQKRVPTGRCVEVVSCSVSDCLPLQTLPQNLQVFSLPPAAFLVLVFAPKG